MAKPLFQFKYIEPSEDMKSTITCELHKDLLLFLRNVSNLSVLRDHPDTRRFAIEAETLYKKLSPDEPKKH
jgi:hypothetical protein